MYLRIVSLQTFDFILRILTNVCVFLNIRSNIQCSSGFTAWIKCIRVMNCIYSFQKVISVVPVDHEH